MARPISATLLLLASNQINNTSVLTVNSDGLLDVNGFSENVGALAINSGHASVGTGTLLPSSLAMTGGTIDGTGSGKVQLSSGVTAISDVGGNSATIGSQTDLNGAIRTFTVNHGPGANDLLISEIIFNGGLTKAGAGTMTISGPMTYTDATTVSAGALKVSGTTLSSTVSAIAAAAIMRFVNGANAGSGTFANIGSTTSTVAGGLIQFADNGTIAGSGIYTNNGGSGTGNGAEIDFNSGASGGNATITNYGATVATATASQLLFNGGSTAGNAFITTNGGQANISGAAGAVTLFSGDATAGAATLITNANGGTFAALPGLTEFKDTSTSGMASITINSDVNSPAFNKWIDSADADHATITVNNRSTADFENTATAGSANLTINAGGLATFVNTATGGSAGLMNKAGGQTQFHNASNAGSASITNMPIGGGQQNGFIRFYDTASAGSATVTNKGQQLNNFAAGGYTEFHNSSTAASGTFINEGAAGASGAYGGETDFYDASNAGTTATFSNYGASADTGGNGGVVQFFNSSRAGTANFTNNPATTATSGNTGGGYTYFNSGTSADHATIINNGSLFSSTAQTAAGHTIFNSGSTPDHGTFTNNGCAFECWLRWPDPVQCRDQCGQRLVHQQRRCRQRSCGRLHQIQREFRKPGQRGNATLTNNGGTVSGAIGGYTYFDTFSTAGAATLIANGGTNGGAVGLIRFVGSSGFDPTGGTARIIANSGGVFDMSSITTSLSVGSIEGAGRFQLGSVTLTTGSLNTDTTVSGLLVDGGIRPGGAGSLTKTGNGKLTLFGANTYTGHTTVNGGTLAVNGSILGAVTVNTSATLRDDSKITSAFQLGENL